MQIIKEKILRFINSQKENTHPTTTNSTNLTMSIFNAYTQRKSDDNRVMELAVKDGYDPYLKIENDQVSNKLYEGDVYSVEYNQYHIKITNKTKNYTKTLNLSNLLNGMNDKDKVIFMKKIQTLPGEVLEDLAIEVDRLESSTGKDMHVKPSNPNFEAGGYFKSNNDSITTNESSLVHELGHAVDFYNNGNVSSNNNNSRVLSSPEFKEAFQIGLKRYIDAGNKQFDYNNSSTWTATPFMIFNLSNYCTANEKELWAELYTALTTGTCKSYNTIVTYFPEAIEVGKELLKDMRSENPLSRHYTPTRSLVNKLL